MLTALCATFRRRAEWTNHVIYAGYSSRLGILEETLTDIHLLEFASAHPGHVWTHKFTKKQESSTSGADWVWCIGQPGSWLTLAIQAKIVSPSTRRCHYLNYKDGQQRRQLVHYARRVGALPLYCLYGHVVPAQAPAAPGAPPEQWACAFLSPRAVHYAATQLRTREQDDLLRLGIPWMLPFCEGARLRREDGGSEAPTPFTGLDVARGFAEAHHRQFSALGRRDLLVPSRNPLALVSTKFPRTVAALLSGYAGRARTASPVASVSVLSSIGLAETMQEFQRVRTPKERFHILLDRLSKTARAKRERTQGPQ